MFCQSSWYNFLKMKHNESKGGSGMSKKMNCGVSCGVTECKYNCDGMHCELNTIHVGNTCDCEHCTCCDSFQKRN